MADDRNKRYIDGYDSVYKDVREGLKKGEKNGHWMWFIFPQVKGLGKSPVSDFYAFDGIGDAKAFYANWGLRRRLVSLFRIVNSFPDKAYLTKCFGEIDSKKFHSCATIFYLATGKRVFRNSLDRFFGGALDIKTVDILRARSEYKPDALPKR